MNKLRKHFSAQFCNLVANTEIGMADIEKLYKWGYKVLPATFTCGGDADIHSKVIRVGRCKLICRMFVLFHEIGHVLNSRNKSIKKVSAHRSTVEQYVRAEVLDEYRAWRYAVDRVNEIYADRPKERHHFNNWARLVKTRNWTRMFREIREAVVTGEKMMLFIEYWADSYKKEKRAAARKRKQTRKKNETSKKARTSK